MSVQGLACILKFLHHCKNNSDVLSFIIELPATFFGFNFFKELFSFLISQSQEQYINIILSINTFLIFNLLMNVRFSFAGCKSMYTFPNHQIYFKNNLIFLKYFLNFYSTLSINGLQNYAFFN